MALFTPSESPAVVVKEIDLTGGVPNVQSTTGAYVGKFRWGPVEKRTLVSSETGLVETFAAPDANFNHNIDFVSASQFLKYSSSLQVVRAVDSASANAFSNTGQRAYDSAGNMATLSNAGAGVIKNLEHFKSRTYTSPDSNGNALYSSGTSQGYTFIGRFPGALGNSLSVEVCPPNSSAFSGWTYKGEFDAVPGQSRWAVKQGVGAASPDEIHVVVVDKDGKFTGTRNTVLERFGFLSLASNAKNDDGTSVYYKDVINETSEYIYHVALDSDYMNRGGEGGAAGLVAKNPGQELTDSSHNFKPVVTSVTIFDFLDGSDGAALSTANITEGFDLFEDKDQVEVDFLIAPSATTTANQTTIVNDLIATAQNVRKDCLVVASPARDDVVNLTNATTITNNIVTTADTFTQSSYLVMDGNFLKVFDKYTDQFIQIPAASSTAGIMAATDRNVAPWFSPAGGRRGQYLGVTGIDYTPTKGQRDTLYKAGVNPIANIPGQGIILFGDKTKLARASAFDRINVRRLFLVLERAIARAAESVLFEFNDEFTRAEFVNIVEPVLREVKGRRGITDFRVVCDETNNTAAVVDRNEFIASIFIKPARSINYVTLNFVAVRSGVDFEEVIGTV